MSFRIRWTTCLFLIIVVGSFSQVPIGVCRSPYENIIAGYNRNSVILRGNLTYSTDDWYFNIPKQLIFNLTIEVPANTSVDVNVTRLLFFLEFLLEDSEFNLVIIMNQTDLPHATYSHTTVVMSDTYSVTVFDDEVEFIPEWSNWVVLGFLVSLDLRIISNTTSDQLENINIYSHKPESVNWAHSPGMFTTGSNDRLYLYEYSEYFDPLWYLGPLSLLGVMIIPCLYSAFYSNSDFRRRRRALNLQNYINKKAEVHGKEYNLGGVRITLAYFMFLAFPDVRDSFGKGVSEWARKNAGLEISSDLEPLELSEDKQPIWHKLRNQLGINARKVDIYLYKQFSRSNRAAEIIRLLRKNDLSVSEDTMSLIELNIDQIVEEEYRRVEPSGALFSNLRGFVEEYLEWIVPDKLSQLRGALEQLEERTGPDVFAAVTLSCREIYQSLVYALVTNQVLPPDSSKPPENMSRNNVNFIVSWLKNQLEEGAREPLTLVEKGFELFEEYAKQLDKIIQRDVHKDKAKLRLQEVTGHITTLYSLLNELFILLERAEFDWPSV